MGNTQSILQMVSDPKNWKKTHKKSYEVYVCRPLPGTECHNKLEDANYVTDENRQFIISGTVGETWVIDIDKLAKTYYFADGGSISPITLQNKCRPDGQMDWQKMKTQTACDINWALLIPSGVENFPVQTSWGDTLLANRPGIGHGLGDFLVCSDNGYGQPNLNDVWVVNGLVFPMTYDLHAFPNMFDQSKMAVNTPYPAQKFVKEGNNKVFKADSSEIYTKSSVDKYIDIARTVAGNLSGYYGNSIGATVQNAEVINKTSGSKGSSINKSKYDYWSYTYDVTYNNGRHLSITVTPMVANASQEKDPLVSIEASNGFATISLKKMFSANVPYYEKGTALSSINPQSYGYIVQGLSGKMAMGVGNDKQTIRTERTSKTGKKSLFSLFKR